MAWLGNQVIALKKAKLATGEPAMLEELAKVVDSRFGALEALQQQVSDFIGISFSSVHYESSEAIGERVC